MTEKQKGDFESALQMARENYIEAENAIAKKASATVAMRRALESAIKVFWIYRWNCYDPTDSVSGRIKKLEEQGEFNIVITQYMYTIQNCGNQEAHGKENRDFKAIESLFSVFKFCMNAISEKVKENIIQEVKKGTVVLREGQIWKGKSNVDVIRKIFNIDYNGYEKKCTVDLRDNFGVEGIAWIVFFNGQHHGTSEKYKWANYILENGRLLEEYVGDKNLTKKDREKILIDLRGRQEAKRLAFQKDPYDTGDEYTVKFLGYYELDDEDTINIKRTYKKKASTFELKEVEMKAQETIKKDEKMEEQAKGQRMIKHYSSTGKVFTTPTNKTVVAPPVITTNKIINKEAFEKWLIARGYKEYSRKGMPSTVYQYSGAVENVCVWENLSWKDLSKSIDTVVRDYDWNGRKKDKGKIGHNTVISALKRFKEFIEE